jgi:hypothetical protein
MILASAQFQPARSPDLNWSKFWKGYLGGLLVVGERPGTIRLIDRQMFFRKPDGWWLKLPAELVPKTHKGRWMALPDWCAEAMLGAGNGNLILDCGVHRRTLHDYHEWLQRLAGVGEAEILPQKAWRRTHDAFMQRLGAGIARDVGQRTLNHSHHSTTTAHYFDITEELRRLLPCIWEEPPPPITTPQLLDRQLRLF